jgi:hypothetical protein
VSPHRSEASRACVSEAAGSTRTAAVARAFAPFN